MHLEGMTITLRPRTPWEAADLGIALTRRHAGTIYRAWLLVTLPVCLLLIAVGALLDKVWLATLLLWWLKPVFDRIVLFVLSRAVFGAAPTTTETLRAQWHWGRNIWRWLHWRRLHPGRALLLPVDLLENLGGAQRRERCRVLARATGSQSLLLTFIGVHIEAMLYLSILALVPIFVPIEFFSDAVQAMWATLFVEPPIWAQALNVLLYWVTISVMEPFYVGAGFGLYLNRRTQLEAWDVEIAFRRLAARLRQSAAPLLLCAAMLASAAALSPSAHAGAPRTPVDAIENAIETAAAPDPDGARTATRAGLDEVFSSQYRDGGAAFESAVATAYRNGDLRPKKTITAWERRRPADPDEPEEAEDGPAWLSGFAKGIAFLGENGLWILLGILIVVLVRYIDRWLPWISDRVAEARRPDPIEVREIIDEPLPADLPAAVRALWRAGRTRPALALFYRAAVARLIDRLGTPLPPGATEAECLRQSRRLDDRGFATLFERIVRGWQGAAYAERPPSTVELDAWLDEWQRRPETAA
jgi:hypothetical protein